MSENQQDNSLRLQRKQVVHELKTWPEYFQAIMRGDKRFEARKNDRDFRIGDWLRLREWDDDYTGREITVRVTYMLSPGADFPAVNDGYCIMSIQNIACL